MVVAKIHIFLDCLDRVYGQEDYHGMEESSPTARKMKESARAANHFILQKIISASEFGTFIGTATEIEMSLLIRDSKLSYGVDVDDFLLRFSSDGH